MDGMREKLDYFIERTDSRLLRIEDGIGDLKKFKWQIIGGSVVISTIVSLAIALAYELGK